MAGTDILTRLPLDLGDGLTMRLATEGDAPRRVEFHRAMHDDSIAAWTGDLTNGKHPTATVGDYAFVETAEQRVVSTICLIPQTWQFCGQPLPVGRPQIVVTDPEWRYAPKTRAS